MFCLIDSANEFLLALNKGISAFAGLNVPKFSFKDSSSDRVADEFRLELLNNSIHQKNSQIFCLSSPNNLSFQFAG